jgi:hypothetical protein
MRLFRGSLVQVSRRRAMLPRLEPTRPVRIERFGCLATRGVKLVSERGVDANAAVGPHGCRHRQQSQGGGESQFWHGVRPHCQFLVHYSWNRTPEGAFDP